MIIVTRQERITDATVSSPVTLSQKPRPCIDPDVRIWPAVEKSMQGGKFARKRGSRRHADRSAKPQASSARAQRTVRYREGRTLMKYHDVEPITRQEAEKNLASEDIAVMCLTLVSMAFFDPDAEWVERVCTNFLAHPAAEIRAISATCLGHLARIHRDPQLERVRSVLKELLKDPEVRPFALDALEDIDTFLGPEAGGSSQKH
jgi:hypothetical protein